MLHARGCFSLIGKIAQSRFFCYDNYMEKIIIIGTLHAGSTPDRELAEVLEKYKSDQLLVEIAQADIDAGKIDDYPPEMIFAYNWAKNNGIDVFGFDSKINVFAEGKTQADNQALIDEQERVMGALTWKDMNNEENLKILSVPGESELIDEEKEQARERELLENIKIRLAIDKTTLIVTGCGHLKFFEENLIGAIVPLK